MSPIIIKTDDASKATANVAAVDAAAYDANYIYYIFKRENVFYKDTYLVFKGDAATLYDALHEMQCDIALEKLVSRGDGDADDTPLDYFCNHAHPCPNQVHPNCQSNWIQLEFPTVEEMTAYILQIQPGYYPYIDIINL